MANIFKPLGRKINNMVFSLIVTGFILLILGVLIVWTDFTLRIVVGMITIAVAYVFFYGAWKIWSVKKDLEKFFKIKL